MEIRQLKYFMAVAEFKSFTKATKKLYVSQPALTKAIRSLESELEVPLLIYNNKSMELTSYGELLYAYCRPLVIQFEEIKNSIRGQSSLQSGLLRLGLPPLIGTLVVPQIIESFIAAHPGIRLEIRQGNAIEIQNMVRDNIFDAGFTIYPIMASDFDIIDVMQGPQAIIISRENPLAEKDTAKLWDLREETFILLDKKYMSYEQIIAACRRENFYPNISMELSSWDLVMHMVERNLGIGILPRPIVEAYPSDSIKCIEIESSIEPWQVALITKQTKIEPPAVTCFKTHVRKILSHKTQDSNS